MKKSHHFKNLIFGLILAIIFSLFGCRTVKKDVIKNESEKIENLDSSKTENKDVKKEVRKVRTSKTSNAKVKRKNIVVVEPINNDKPIEITDSNGETKKVYNAKVVFTDETETDNSVTESKTDSTANVTDKSKTETSSSSKKKESAKSSQSKLDAKANIFIILLPYFFWILFFLVVWLVWKNRKRIPYIKNLFS